MKTEFITFRSELPKATVRRLAGGNVSRFLNGLIAQQHARARGPGVDWDAHWQRKAQSRRQFNLGNLTREER